MNPRCRMESHDEEVIPHTWLKNLSQRIEVNASIHDVKVQIGCRWPLWALSSSGGGHF